MLLRLLIITAFAAMTAFSQVPAIGQGVSQELAKWRASQYSNISYKLNLTLEKMSPVLKGTIEIRLTAYGDPVIPGKMGLQYFHIAPVFLDWRKIAGHEKDSTISNVSINGKKVEKGILNESALKDFQGGDTLKAEYFEYQEHLLFSYGTESGENVIKLDFTSPILTSGSAITRYVDKEDGAEYIYSLFVPSDASTAFPVFDQPDLKARFRLTVNFPHDPDTDTAWTVVSNAKIRERSGAINYFDPVTHAPINVKHDETFAFEETQPISTYVFAFATGPFLITIPTGGFSAIDSVQSSSHIYFRKSQREKFQPHAAEVARLRDESIKYLETYFDYKFPFPKYDLVLIPEFPFGGMEHAGATFLREQSVIFPQEPTKNNIISRALLIFHETAHQWFGDTVTMKWFDDLWLKEGFAEFMAYKTLEKVMPEANAWKVFYERNKQAAYATDSTKGTTPIYQPIANLNSAKSAYGNIVYRKAPSFLRQAEFYLGEDKFQTAVRAFLKKHEFANAGWEDLVKEFETASGQDLKEWAKGWVKNPGVPFATSTFCALKPKKLDPPLITSLNVQEVFAQQPFSLLRPNMDKPWGMKFNMLVAYSDGKRETLPFEFSTGTASGYDRYVNDRKPILFIFPNYQDYGYGIFLLDDKSRDYVLKNIQNEKDDFLRTMMWGSLWDSVREAELDPKDYVELVIKVLGVQSAGFSPLRRDKSRTLNGETDEGTIQTLLSRVTTAMNYYLSDTGGNATVKERARSSDGTLVNTRVSARDARNDLQARLEDILIEKIQNASTSGQRITYYRSFLNIASTDKARGILKQILKDGGGITGGNPSGSAGAQRSTQSNLRTLPTGRVSASSQPMSLKTKDKFDIVTRLAILSDPEAPKLLAQLEKSETSDDAKRYAYAAHAAFGTTENKAKFFNDFLSNKDISESWIEAAFGPFNAVRHNELTLPYLEKALAELPNLKHDRKIFFVNGWLAAFIGGQHDEKALATINKFLADNPNLDKDLRLKILENVDVIERAVKIRGKYTK